MAINFYDFIYVKHIYFFRVVINHSLINFLHYSFVKNAKKKKKINLQTEVSGIASNFRYLMLRLNSVKYQELLPALSVELLLSISIVKL